MVSVTGISSGVATTTRPVRTGSERIASIQSVCERMRPTWTSVLIACGAARWPTTWPVADGVDDDEVVVALADLVAELADGEDLLDTGRRGRHEVEHPRHRPDPPHDRDAQVDAHVLVERALGVHRHRRQAGLHLPRVVADRPALVEVGEVALGVDLAHQGALAALRPEQGEAGGDGRLADPSLAGDEDQPAVEEVGAHHGRRVRTATRTRPGARRSGCRSRRTRPCSTGSRPADPCGP